MPQSIDDIILKLENIISECTSAKSRAGYFACLYYKVTCRVKEGIVNNEYEDGNRMKMLDVLFASRYLEAWELWKTKGNISQSWKVAFESTEKSSVLVLQHLLLGINAHINLDLGIAAIETTKTGNYTLSGLRKDFNSINSLLNSFLYEVMGEINRVSPLLSLLGFHATHNNSMLINFTIGAARDGAWCFAEDLNNDKDKQEFIQQRDKEISQLGQSLISSDGFFLWLTIKIIHLFEWRNPVNIINVLISKKTTTKFSQIKKQRGG